MDVKLEAEEKIRLPESVLARDELRPDVEPAGPMGVTAPPRGFEFSPLNARRWRNFKANRRGFSVFSDKTFRRARRRRVSISWRPRSETLAM